MEYKETLNLPITDFPMKANLTKKEPEALKKWEAEDLYAKFARRKRVNPNTFFMMARLTPTVISTWGML